MGQRSTCQQQAPHAEAVLRHNQHGKHQQRVELQVRAVDCLRLLHSTVSQKL